MDKNNMSFGMKIVIVIFAVILVLSLMLPFFSSCGNTATQDSSTQDSSDTSLTTVEGVDEVYQAKIDELQAKLAADSTSLLNTVNMGNTYMEWAEALGQIDTSTLTSSSTASASAADALSLIAGSSSVDSDAAASEDFDGVTSTAADESASTDTDAASDAVAELQQRISDTYAAAIPYYDQYLAQENSKSVTVNRAMCKYYSGDEEGAIADLEAFVSEDDTFSPAWYSLGQLYESQGRLSDASDAFTAALSADQDESYNLSIYASYQLSMISAYQDALASASAETSEASDASTSIDEASTIEVESLSSDGETSTSTTQGDE